MSKKSKNNPLGDRGNEVLLASYNAGFAEGRLEAIEEGIDAVAALILKAETLVDGFGDDAPQAMRDNADHTLRALHLAFAAVSGSVNGGTAFQDLLAQARQRLLRKAGAMH